MSADPLPPPPPSRDRAARILLGLLAVLVVGNMAGTALLVRQAMKPKHWTYRTDFFAEGEADASLSRLDQEGWEVLSVRRAHAGDVDTGRWGMEAFLRRPSSLDQ